jgi:hypothetical protein
MPDKGVITQDSHVEMHEIKSCNGADISWEDVEWLLNQQQSIAQDHSFEESKLADPKDIIQETKAASGLNKIEKRRLISLESAV